MFSVRQDELLDWSRWNRRLNDVPLTKHGVEITVIDNDDNLKHIINTGLIPSSVFSNEITDDYNGSTRYYWVVVTNWHRGFIIEKDILDKYVERISSLLVYNGRGDVKNIEYKGRCGIDYTYLLKVVKI